MKNGEWLYGAYEQKKPPGNGLFWGYPSVSGLPNRYNKGGEAIENRTGTSGPDTMIKIQCPTCGIDSYFKSTSFTVMQLNHGSVVELQCGDRVKATGEPARDDPRAPYVEIEVSGMSREGE